MFGMQCSICSVRYAMFGMQKKAMLKENVQILDQRVFIIQG